MAQEALDLAFAASSGGKIKDLRQAVEKLKADVSIPDSDSGSVALHWAARGAHFDCAEYLLQCAPETALVANKLGNTPLHYATIAGSKKVTQVLVKHGAAINALNKNGQTPLHGAVGQNWDHVVEYLASLEDASCRACKKKTCREHMVDINAQDANGRSPLHYASDLFSSQVYRILLERGADETIKDDNGEFPKSPAKKRKEFVQSNGPVFFAILFAILAYVYYLYKEKGLSNLNWSSWSS